MCISCRRHTTAVVLLQSVVVHRREHSLQNNVECENTRPREEDEPPSMPRGEASHDQQQHVQAEVDGHHLAVNYVSNEAPPFCKTDYTAHSTESAHARTLRLTASTTAHTNMHTRTHAHTHTRTHTRTHTH